jgi:ribosome-associated heat shock protein Hsp15
MMFYASADVPAVAGSPERTRQRESIMTSVRMDKWLWAARFFKTRALAVKACELGRIQSGGQLAKPSRDIHAGDMLQIKNDSGDFQIEVLLLSDIRGPAAVAQTLYRETEASRAARQKLIEDRKLLPQMEWTGEGRPSKRDRRQIDRFRGRA